MGGDEKAHPAIYFRHWLVQVGEPLPTDPSAPRLYFIGLMAREFQPCGSALGWFTTDFNHLQGKVVD